MSFYLTLNGYLPNSLVCCLRQEFSILQMNWFKLNGKEPFNIKNGQGFYFKSANALLGGWFARKNSRRQKYLQYLLLLTDTIQVRTITNSIVPIQSGNALY